MGKNRSDGSFFQAQSHLGFSGIGGAGMINSFDERYSGMRGRDRQEYDRQAMMQQQRHIDYNIAITKIAEQELQLQELVDEDEEIYYLLT